MSQPLSLAVAQPKCVPFDVAANALAHAEAILAARAQLVVFPELSLTGYEPGAEPIDLDDRRLARLFDACSRTGSTALAGAPVAMDGSRYLATLAVTGAGARAAYSKMFLGGDEADHFMPGPGPATLTIGDWRLGLGICKDTRIPEHIGPTLAQGIDLYVAGLVHHPHELEDQDGRAARIWAQGNIPVAFASAAGNVGREYPTAIGHSCIWDSEGKILARAGAQPGEVAVATLRR